MSKQTELAQVADTITVNSGNVGIGTDSPARTLEVYSSAPAIKLNNGTNAFTIGTGAFVDGSNSLVFFDEGVGERMRLDSSGRVGIGTSSPNARLEVEDAGNTTGVVLKVTADDTSPYAFVVGNDTFSTTDTDGLAMWVGNDGACKIDARGTGALHTFRVQGTERMRIDSVGRVTKPNQPYFNVTKNGSSYTLGNNATFVFNRVMSNIGSHYNSSTGRFTAPVAGKYLFIFQTILIGAYTSAAIKYYKNNSRIYGGDIHFSPNPSPSNSWTNVTNNQIVTMNANDYIEVRNLGPTVTYHGDHWAHFTGMLLG